MGSLVSYMVDRKEDSSDDDEEDNSSDLDTKYSESTSEEEVCKKTVFDSSSSSLADDNTPEEMITTDAAVCMTKQLTDLVLSDVSFIERSLDLNEKISLIYLLYEDPTEALKDCVALTKKEPRKVLFTWASHEEENMYHSWQGKLIESLCIIQNYYVLRELGYNKGHLIDRFLPHQPFATIYVNKTRKVLYNICDNLLQTDTLHLLNAVTKDFIENHLEYQNFISTYLEMYFLYWESIRYISLDDVSKLYKVFKQLDKIEICDKLQSITRRHDDNNKNNNNNNGNSRRPDNLGIRIRRLSSSSSKTVDNINNEIYYNSPITPDLSSINSRIFDDQKNNEFYMIDPNNPGVCLIINQEFFYQEIQPQYQHLLPKQPSGNCLSNREGTEKDKNDLILTFKAFGYKVIIKENLMHLELIEAVQEVAQSIQNESSLFVCIMSHGDEGVVYGSNSCEVKVQQIQDIIGKTRNLLGKPKILILQSCQGNNCQKVIREEDDLATDGLGESGTNLVTTDTLTFYATVPGFSAIRNKRTGSWFIQALCQKMREYGEKCHFDDICTKIMNDVTKKVWTRHFNEKTEEVAMVPVKVSTLRKYFFLPPIKNTSC